MINEKKLLEAINKSNVRWEHLWKRVVIDVINNQPKVGEWIPVSERLPDEDARVIVCNDVGSIMVGCVDVEEHGHCITCTIGHHYMRDVIAWMPLPEPYNE